MASETFSLQQLTVHNTENLTELHWDEKHYVCTMNVPKKSRNWLTLSSQHMQRWNVSSTLLNPKKIGYWL